LDEIPNLINVLVGDMSVVGPRADRIEMLEKAADMFPYVWDRTRFVKPGITGLAQIKLQSDGSINAKSNPELYSAIPLSDIEVHQVNEARYKLYYDVAYTLRLQKFWTFLFTDISIIIRTPIVMFFKRNVI
jgi:lipopolysaccharide/colanic/teichoic acid biosynthesis glycosyltransferase